MSLILLFNQSNAADILRIAPQELEGWTRASVSPDRKLVTLKNASGRTLEVSYFVHKTRDLAEAAFERFKSNMARQPHPESWIGSDFKAPLSQLPLGDMVYRGANSTGSYDRYVLFAENVSFDIRFNGSPSLLRSRDSFLIEDVARRIIGQELAKKHVPGGTKAAARKLGYVSVQDWATTHAKNVQRTAGLGFKFDYKGKQAVVVLGGRRIQYDNLWSRQRSYTIEIDGEMFVLEKDLLKALNPEP